MAFPQADPDANYIKLTGLPSALIRNQVALPVMRNKQLEKQKNTAYMFIIIDISLWVGIPRFRGWESGSL